MRWSCGVMALFGSSQAWAGELPPVCADLEVSQWQEVLRGFESRVQPDGRLVFEVSSPGGAELARLGLREGDLLVSLDGRSFRTMDEAAEVGLSLTRAEAFTVELVRDGAPLSLRVRLVC
jgi:S1-C subfamily serine protease